MKFDPVVPGYWGCRVFRVGLRCGGSTNDEEVFRYCSNGCPAFDTRMDRGDYSHNPNQIRAMDPTEVIMVPKGSDLSIIPDLDLGSFPEERVRCEYCEVFGDGGSKCANCGAGIPLGPIQLLWQEGMVARMSAPKYMIKGGSWKGIDFS